MITTNKCNEYPHEVSCVHCGSEHVILLNRKDLEMWMSGEAYIQDSLDYISKSDRELLISGTCDSCWKKMWGEN